MNYLIYYDLERYLFTDVTRKFSANKYIDAFDFFCIIIWKANRAKSKIAKRLAKHGQNLNEQVIKLTSSISQQTSDEDRLRLLIEEWGFLLPMATTILTVLYPDKFTIYDVRVCEILQKHTELSNCTKWENIWKDYQNYKKDVEQAVSSELSLRDKDRFLWATSFYKQLRSDIQSNFIRSANEKSLNIA